MFLKSLKTFLNALNSLDGGPIYTYSTHNIVVDIIDYRLSPLPVLKLVLIDLIGHFIAPELFRIERLDYGIRYGKRRYNRRG